jgi:hypothetical protein
MHSPEDADNDDTSSEKGINPFSWFVATIPPADLDLPVATVSYDLSLVPELPDPSDFLKEIEVLDK